MSSSRRWPNSATVFQLASFVNVLTLSLFHVYRKFKVYIWAAKQRKIYGCSQWNVIVCIGRSWKFCCKQWQYFMIFTNYRTLWIFISWVSQGFPSCDYSPSVQLELLHSKFHLCSAATRGLLLSTYVKFANLFPEIKAQIQEVRGKIWPGNGTNFRVRYLLMVIVGEILTCCRDANHRTFFPLSTYRQTLLV